MLSILLLALVLVVLVPSQMAFTDQCTERYKICSIKGWFILQKICRKNGGLLPQTLKYAGQDIFTDCCQLGGCTRQYLCDFCSSSCCQIAIDTVLVERR